MRIYSYSFDIHNSGTEHGAVTEAELAQLLSNYATGRQRPYGNQSVPALPPALASAIQSADSSAILEAFGEWYSNPPLHGDYAVPHCDDHLQWEEAPALTAMLTPAQDIKPALIARLEYVRSLTPAGAESNYQLSDIIDDLLSARMAVTMRDTDEAMGPVPAYDPETDGDYSAFLALHNCD